MGLFWKRWAIRVVRIAVAVYLGVTLVLFLWQNSFIFPGAATQGHPDCLVHAGANSELLELHARDGTKIAALFGKASVGDPSHAASVIFCYGNGACLAYSDNEFNHLRQCGANVIIPEYEGYGMSGGSPSEAGCYAAADAAYDYLLSRADIDHDKIVASGWSLGAAAAIDLAARKPVAGLMTFSAFTNIRAMARRLIPWLPTSLIVRSSFDNLGKIRGIHCPMLIVHGVIDDLIPPRMSDALSAAAGGPVTRVRVEGARHNDLFDVGGAKLWNQVAEFLADLKGINR